MIFFYLILLSLLVASFIFQFKCYKNKLKIQERILKLLDLDITIDEV